MEFRKGFLDLTCTSSTGLLIWERAQKKIQRQRNISPISGSKFLYSVQQDVKVVLNKKGAGVGGEKECHSSISFVLSRKCLVHSWKRLHSLSPVESCYFTI